MYTEQALLDAREVRATLVHRTDVLDEVKRLPLLPDGTHVTATLLADYFEVDAVVLRRVVRKHAGELGSHGYRQLQGEELRAFVAVNLPESRAPRRQLGVFTVQAALVLAMVLDSGEVARVIRTGLLEPVAANAEGAGVEGAGVERGVTVRGEFTVGSDGTVRCRHGEMAMCVPAPGEDGGRPSGPYYRCPETDRHGIRGGRAARPCGSVTFVDVVRRLSGSAVPQWRPDDSDGRCDVRLSVGDIQVYGSASDIAAVLRGMGVVADPRR
ncbi:hypothetical protein ACH4SP_13845 [Streptomyces sp. NPDC021093]|uniref:hypothetical protein n=1 Tax=Streptomyces sp. NPDC021093 TaxID=3365112 RepID=UPI00378A37FC